MKARFGWVFASAILLGTIGTASAADMAVKAAPLPPVVAYNWTGFYVGGEIGGIWGQADANYVFPPPATFSNHASTGIGGGFVGFQYQWNRLVLGVEANGLGVFEQSLGRSFCNPVTSCAPGLAIGHRWQDGIFTAGGRIGLAAGMWMPYFTGGYAATRLYVPTFTPAIVGVAESFTQDRSGWYAGVGVDYALNRNWIIGVEYRHYDFGTARGVPTRITGVLNPADSLDTSLKADTVVGRVSYKFWSAGPIVAKY